MIASIRFISFSLGWAPCICFIILPMPGIMPMIDSREPIFLICCSWAEILQVELVLLQLLLEPVGLLFVEDRLGLFHQGQNVTHAEDARHQAVGMEHLQCVQLFAQAHELDRLAGDRLDGKGRAPLGVAVQLGQHHAGNVKPLIEAAGDVDRFLAGHGIRHEENFPRLRRRP